MGRYEAMPKEDERDVQGRIRIVARRVVASNGDVPASEFAVGILAAEAVSASIRDAVLQAESRGGVPDLATTGTRNEQDPAWSLEE